MARGDARVRFGSRWSSCPVFSVGVATPRLALPVWAHQAVAYAITAAIVGFAIHAPDTSQALLLAGAAVPAILGLITRGPLGAVRMLGPRLLRSGEFVAAAGLAALPFAGGSWPRLEVLFTLELAAIALARLGFVGAIPGGQLRQAARGESSRAEPEPTSPASAAAEAAARRAGRRVGVAARRAKQAGDGLEPKMLGGARALGRMAGRRQAGKHRNH
jgi:hypothetical protein